MLFDTLALSGGGIKGIQMLGALQYAYDRNIINSVIHYIGTSVGGIICYLLIIGYKPKEIISNKLLTKLLGKIRSFDMVSLINGEGVISFSEIQQIIEMFTLEKAGKFFTMKELEEKYNKKLYLCTYNMSLAKECLISAETHPTMPVITALRMSSNLPLIFDRFKYQNDYYIDGGLTNMFPVDYGLKIGSKKIFGINMLSDEKTLYDKPEDGLLSYIARIIETSRRSLTLKNIEKSDNGINFITTMSCNYNLLKMDIPMKEKLDVFSEGYQIVKNEWETRNDIEETIEYLVLQIDFEKTKIENNFDKS